MAIIQKFKRQNFINNKPISTVLLIFALSIFAIQLIGGNNFYVSETLGNDNNNGLSPTSPFRKISKAITVATHGDTINIMAGVYTNLTYGVTNHYKEEQAIRIFNKTTSTNNYLVIRPYNNQKVTLKCDGNFVVLIQNSNNIRIEKMEIIGEKNNIPLDTAIFYQFKYRQCLNTNCTNYIDTFRVALGTPPEVVEHLTFPILTNIKRPTTVNAEGITLRNSHHIDILNNVVTEMPSAGIRIGSSDYVKVIGNEIFDCNQRNSVGTPALVLSTIHSIDNNDATKIFIENNSVHDNRNVVYSWAPNKTYIEPKVDEGKGISLEHCQKNSTANTSWEHGRVRIVNNICYRNGFSGINTNEAERVDILFNTCYQNIATGIGKNTGLSINDAEDVRVYNNIVYSVNNFGGDAMAIRPLTWVTNDNIIFKNNIVVGTVDTDFDSVDINTMYVDPMWVDTLQFRLSKTSPAINMALDTLTPMEDFYKQNRPVGMPDIGAVEYLPALCSTIVTNGNNNGSGSLRNAIACAAEGDTIFFENVMEVNIMGQLLINKSLTIYNPNANNRPVIYLDYAAPGGISGLFVEKSKTVKLVNIDLVGLNNTNNLPIIQTNEILAIKGFSKVKNN